MKKRIYLDPKLKKYVLIEKVITTEDSVNPLLVNVLFSYSLKTSENLWFSEVFGGCKKGTLGSYNQFRKQSFSPKVVETKIFSTGFVSTHF